MDIFPCRDAAELRNKAASALRDFLDKAVKQKGKAVLAVPGGRSVKGIFEQLKTAGLPWDKIHIFWVDERKVPMDNTESNFKMAQDMFLAELIKNKKLPQRNIHPYDCSKQNVAGYTQELLHFGRAFDVVLLSAGEDGHIASLFPRHASFYDESAGYIDVHDAPKLPVERISASRKLIQSAGVVILLFAGEGKKKAYEKFMDRSVPEEECPAKIIQKVKEMYVLISF